jgi:Tfp pilus assembly protein PilZ
MGKRYGALRLSGNVFDQKTFSKSTKRNPKNNPYKKMSIMNGSEELTGNPKFKRYDTTFSRLLTLILTMSEREQLLLLRYAKSIVDERTLPRNLCLIPVNCKLKKRNYDGLILDINSCGAYIDTNEPFPIGQETNLFFFNPFSHKNVQLAGKIIWSSDHGIGVKFSDWFRMRYIW